MEIKLPTVPNEEQQEIMLSFIKTTTSVLEAYEGKINQTQLNVLFILDH